MTNIFEKAVKDKLRFTSQAGTLTVEDVWDLPLENKRGASLDSLAKSLNRAIKETEEESFVVKKTKANDVLELKFEIVKHIIEVKLANADRAEKAAATKARKEVLLAALASKNEDALKSASKEDIEKELAELG